MRIVIALGGHALLRRGEPMTTEVQRHNIRIAARAIAPLAVGYRIQEELRNLLRQDSRWPPCSR